jgi:hypothetical protein
MFGIKKPVNTVVKQRREMAKKLHGLHINYVVERLGDCDDIIIGREGALITRGKEFIVFSSQHDVFRSYIDDTDFSELMSLGGAVIKGYDLLSGKERSIIAHYTRNA